MNLRFKNLIMSKISALENLCRIFGQLAFQMAFLNQKEAGRYQPSFEALKVTDYDYDEKSDSLCEVSDRDHDEICSQGVSKDLIRSDNFGCLRHNRINNTTHLLSPPIKGRCYSAEACENGKIKCRSHCSESTACDDTLKWLLERCGGDFLFLREVWHTFCHQGQYHLNSMRAAMYENDLDVVLFAAVSFASC